MLELTDKVIVLTGSNGLLGKQIGGALKKQGAKVIGTDLRFDNPDPDNVTMDITDEESVKEVVDTVVKKYGKIDGWINNAYPRTSDWGKKLEVVPYESWRKNVDMHLNGYFLCCRTALEEMKKRKCGSLINMSSIYGSVAPDFSVYEGTEMTMPVAYSAIKGGINTLTKYLASYYGPHNIRVNAISPGGIFDHQPEPFVTHYVSKVPLRRMGSPDDIIPAVCFLLADESAYITGQNIMVDGGWTIS
jgi:NAD(P)-dependent dehydrogenase (short-subunit alcohol dehydrogenase family)